MTGPGEITVLYVEDDPVLRSLFAELIHGRGGISVVGTAANADAAIEFVRTNRVDVALLDLALGSGAVEVLVDVLELVVSLGLVNRLALAAGADLSEAATV